VIRSLAANLALALVSIVAALLAVEVGMRLFGSLGTDVPLHVLKPTPFFYGLNPDHPEISSQGTRDDEAVLPKPDHVFRILVIGDSVAYGMRVPKEDAFPSGLERRLRQDTDSIEIEVVNTSVPGYTAYSELQYYLTQGRSFEPDLVLVAACLNDVANPRLHWNYAKEEIREIPGEAIPNLQYDQQVRVRIERRRALRGAVSEELSKRRPSLFEDLALVKFLRARMDRTRTAPLGLTSAHRSRVPTMITGEDAISIEVLMEPTPEWTWLTDIYDRLAGAVRADGAKFAIVFLPLAYQLDRDYPHIPQQRLVEWCESRGLLCLDVLPALRDYPMGDVFLMERSGFLDIWHLTEHGHDLVAERLALFLRDAGLLGAVEATASGADPRY
jgi:hypothetical protein